MKAPYVMMALVLAFTVASAQGRLPSFDELDANRDGRLSVSEARRDRRVATRFAAADVNQDGYLDPTEYALIAS